jgi:hypothetical protein
MISFEVHERIGKEAIMDYFRGFLEDLRGVNLLRMAYMRTGWLPNTTSTNLLISVKKKLFYNMESRQ